MSENNTYPATIPNLHAPHVTFIDDPCSYKLEQHVSNDDIVSDYKTRPKNATAPTPTCIGIDDAILK